MSRRLNISIDDVSPHPMSGIGVIDSCMRVIDQFPDAKFTLFVPTAYSRTMHVLRRPDTRTDWPLILFEHPEFCNALRNLSSDNFEVGYHGRFHGIPGKSNNDEMKKLSAEEFDELVDQMFDDVVAAGLTNVFKPLLRPPAMYMSAAAIRRAESRFKVLALSPRISHRDSYDDADVDVANVVYANVWIPDDRLESVDPNDDVELLYHACEWDAGYFSRTLADELIVWLRENPVDFCFMEDML